MYLSRLLLNPRYKGVQRDLADCQALHRTVLSAFSDLAAEGEGHARQAVGALHRVDVDPRTGGAALLVQSRVEPCWTRLPAGYLLGAPAVKSVAALYQAIPRGAVLRFRLRANPTRKIETKSGPDGQRRNGKRVDLCDEPKQLAWLTRKAAQGGFTVLSVRQAAEVPDVQVRPEPRVWGFRPDAGGGRRRLTFAVATFDGHLRVDDPSAFRACLENGCGSAKAYGFGLLSIGPAVLP